ncbi:MAG: aminoacyl-tRNA hydrolase [Prevotellaceae bacterium]|jgi:PTH1 family peptidyl-tRNA hydrolase|nr:aminoacyl-tRNA hydrolase [Prevotellaceae bacterium]
MAFLIVGLGNIGPEYANTRHNVGFDVLNTWAKAANARFTSVRYGAITEIMLKGKRFMLLKPSTYMNMSGKAVNYWLQAERITAEGLLVVVDDLALPFGILRMRKQGSDGGHNGLKNINEIIGNQQYARLRVGIGNAFLQGRQIDYVLSEWSDEEQKTLPAVLDKAVEAVKAFGLTGIERTMNTFNTPQP